MLLRSHQQTELTYSGLWNVCLVLQSAPATRDPNNFAEFGGRILIEFGLAAVDCCWPASGRRLQTEAAGHWYDLDQLGHIPPQCCQWRWTL